MAANNNAPFIVRPEYTAIAAVYRNAEYIADRALPRIPVGSVTFKYGVHRVGDWFSVPDTKVGRTSRPGQAETGVDETEASTEDFAIDVPVPNFDRSVAPPNWDPYARAVEYGANIIALDREVRAKAILFNAASYATANKVTLAGVTQWDNASSDPYTQIRDAMATMLVAPTKMVLGLSAWTVLARHPKITAGVFGTVMPGREATEQQVASLLGLREIVVGKAKINTAKKGQTPVLAAIWGDQAALIVDNPTGADILAGNQFAVTAQFGTRIAGTIDDPNMGMRGGVYVRTGEAVKELLTASDLGYLFSDILAAV